MKFYAGIFLVFAICFLQPFGNGMIFKGLKGKLQESGGKSLALEELKSVFKEEEFGEILKWIDSNKVCLRRGIKAENACYALSAMQFLGDKEVDKEWLAAPYGAKKGNTILWYNRLYNSVAFTLEIEKESEAPMLLGKGAVEEGESYTAKFPIGNGKTFPKAMIGEQVGKQMSLAKPDDLKDVKEPVKKVLQFIGDTWAADIKEG